MWYAIKLLDADGCELAMRDAPTFSLAKESAARLLSDEWAHDCETTHAALRTAKAEILNARGECVWDSFL